MGLTLTSNEKEAYIRWFSGFPIKSISGVWLFPEVGQFRFSFFPFGSIHHGVSLDDLFALDYLYKVFNPFCLFLEDKEQKQANKSPLNHLPMSFLDMPALTSKNPRNASKPFL